MTTTNAITSDTGFRPMTPEAHAKAVQEALAPALCEACQARPGGHGHFALYCPPCADLPLGQAAPIQEELT